MAQNKAAANLEGNQRVLFKILDTAGTPTIVSVCPSHAAGDISIVDGGDGDYDVTIKNMKGPQGVAHIKPNAHVISTFASCTARSYSGDDLAFTISVENDASTATDSSVDVEVEVY